MPYEYYKQIKKIQNIWTILQFVENDNIKTFGKLFKYRQYSLFVFELQHNIKNGSRRNIYRYSYFTEKYPMS